MYFYLAVAIFLEVIGTASLKMSEGFTKLIPSLVTLLTYAGAFYFLSLTLRSIPLGIAYAIWSGAGIVLISLIGAISFNQKLDLAAITGIGLIIAGVVIINLWSSSGH